MKNHPETDHCGFDRNASISEDCYVCTCGYVDRETPNPRPSQLTEQVRGAIAAGPALLPPTHPEAIKYGKKRETAKEFAERVALLAISDFSPRPEVAGSEVDALRRGQALAVVPLVGNVLDHWDSLPNDLKDHIREIDDGLEQAIDAVQDAMENHEPDTSRSPRGEKNHG